MGIIIAGGSGLVMSLNVYDKCTINNTFGAAIEIDFSVNLYKAFGFGRSRLFRFLP